jgi:hypothetical protein
MDTNLEKKCKSECNGNYFMPMFTAVLFIIAKYWNRPRCPSVNEKIKVNLIYLNNVKLFSDNKE